MRCDRCGNDVLHGDMFCGKCGKVMTTYEGMSESVIYGKGSIKKQIG